MATIKYHYWCRNTDCELKFKSVHVIKEEEESNREEKCEVCNVPMYQIGEFGTVGFNLFDGMDKHQKKAMLKKRSSEHFKTHIKDKKIAMDRRIVKNFRNNN